MIYSNINGKPKYYFFKPTCLLNLVVWIDFLNYFEWTNNSMCNSYLQTWLLHITCALCFANSWNISYFKSHNFHLVPHFEDCFPCTPMNYDIIVLELHMELSYFNFQLAIRPHCLLSLGRLFLVYFRKQLSQKDFF
jgi:hypothetical protein